MRRRTHVVVLQALALNHPILVLTNAHLMPKIRHRRYYSVINSRNVGLCMGIMKLCTIVCESICLSPLKIHSLDINFQYPKHLYSPVLTKRQLGRYAYIPAALEKMDIGKMTTGGHFVRVRR